MFHRALLNKVAPTLRRIHTTSVARSGHDTRGIYGSNLPFNVENRFALITTMCLFFGSGLALPFLSTRNMILAKNG